MESEQRARDYWLFRYFANGMNPKDTACLKYKNINGDYLIFERAKTERAMRSEPKPISVFITDDMKCIMERWGNKDKSSNNFIFPILGAWYYSFKAMRTHSTFCQFHKRLDETHLEKTGY